MSTEFWKGINYEEKNLLIKVIAIIFNGTSSTLNDGCSATLTHRNKRLMAYIIGCLKSLYIAYCYMFSEWNKCWLTYPNQFIVQIFTTKINFNRNCSWWRNSMGCNAYVHVVDVDYFFMFLL